MAGVADNPLISTKPSDTPLTVLLHPLVLLTASDLLTRHRVRGEEGPLAGILLGRQSGQETTAEHAFPAHLMRLESGEWILHHEWLESRIQQFKDVHKAPALDVVGWFTTCPESGPLLEHIPIQKRMMAINDNGIFLAIHPSTLNSSETANRKLPLTIYECMTEGDAVPDDGNMQIDGDDGMQIKFRELPYSIETDETEMIAIDYVAKGAGSAAAVSRIPLTDSSSGSSDIKGKRREDGKVFKKDVDAGSKTTELTTEEEDQIAGITTRLNSVKMLQSRLQALIKFVQSLPPSYISDAQVALSSTAPAADHIFHLRSIQALLTRLTLLTPASNLDTNTNAVREAGQYQRNDVALTKLLAQLGQDVQALDDVGKKFATVELAKTTRSKGKGGINSNAYGGLEEHDARVAGFSVSEGMLV